MSADAVLEAFTASALHRDVNPRTGLLDEVEALVDSESFLDLDARYQIGAIADNEVHVQRLKVRNHVLH